MASALWGLLVEGPVGDHIDPRGGFVAGNQPLAEIADEGGAAAARMLRLEVSKNRMAVASSKVGELTTSMTTWAPTSASSSPWPVMTSTPVRRDAAVFGTGATHLNVYLSDYAGANRANAVVWSVGDELELIAADLRAKGGGSRNIPRASTGSLRAFRSPANVATSLDERAEALLLSL